MARCKETTADEARRLSKPLELINKSFERAAHLHGGVVLLSFALVPLTMLFVFVFLPARALARATMRLLCLED
jgi:hypothetical protein